jgi:hypothetical protein
MVYFFCIYLPPEKAIKAKSERDMKYALRRDIEIIKFINTLD